MLAYTNFDQLIIIWAVLSLLGLAAASWSFRESALDHRALKTAQDDDATKANVNLSALLQELTRGAVHLIFLGVAAVSMFVAPAVFAAHHLLKEFVTYAFVAIPGILGIASIIALVMRRRLEHLLSNRTTTKGAPNA